MITTRFSILLTSLLVAVRPAALAAVPDAGWEHSGSMFILTTPEGADLPAGESVCEFPLLVRLKRESFDPEADADAGRPDRPAGG